MSVIRRWRERAAELWRRAKSERATPRQIGLAFGVGVFAGCTPAMGFHGPVAIAFATVLRLNRLFAWLGSRVSNMLILPWIVLAEIQIAHRLRTGAYLAMTAREALAHGTELLLDWCLGMIPVGGGLGLFFGLTAWAIAERRARRRADESDQADESDDLTPRRPGEPRPPSSGSPP